MTVDRNIINTDYDFCKYNKKDYFYTKLIRLKYNNFRRLYSNNYHKKLIIKKFNKILKLDKSYSKDDIFIYENRFELNRNYYLYNDNCDNFQFLKIKCNICFEKSYIPNWICNTCNNEICYFCIDKIYKSSIQNKINFNCAFCRTPILNIPKYNIQLLNYEYDFEEPILNINDEFIVPDDDFLHIYDYRMNNIGIIALKIYYYIKLFLCFLILIYFSLKIEFGKIFYYLEDYFSLIIYLTLNDFI